MPTGAVALNLGRGDLSLSQLLQVTSRSGVWHWRLRRSKGPRAVKYRSHKEKQQTKRTEGEREKKKSNQPTEIDTSLAATCSPAYDPCLRRRFNEPFHALNQAFLQGRELACGVSLGWH